MKLESNLTHKNYNQNQKIHSMSSENVALNYKPTKIQVVNPSLFLENTPEIVYPDGYTENDEIIRIHFNRRIKTYTIACFLKKLETSYEFSAFILAGPQNTVGTKLYQRTGIHEIPSLQEIVWMLRVMNWPVRALLENYLRARKYTTTNVEILSTMYDEIFHHVFKQSTEKGYENPYQRSVNKDENEEEINLEELLRLSEGEGKQEELQESGVEIDLEELIRLSEEEDNDEEIDLEELLGLSEEEDKDQDEISDEDSMAFLSMITGEKVENKEQMDQVINGFIKKAQQIGGLKKKTKQLDPLTTIKGSLSFNLTMYMQYETDIRPNSDEGFEKAIVLAIKLITRWPELNQSKEYDIKEALKVIDNDMRTQMNGITEGIAAQQDEFLQKSETEVVYQLASSIRQFVQQQKPDSGALDRYDFVVEVVLQLLWGDTALDSQLIDHVTKSKEFAEATDLIVNTMNS